MIFMYPCTHMGLFQRRPLHWLDNDAMKIKNKNKGNPQEVMEVEKTVSPKTLFGTPNDFPANDCPVFRWRIAEALRGAIWAE